MINLLSDVRKQHIRAARHNVVLRRYVNGLVMLLLLMLAAFGAGYGLTYLSHQEAS